MNPRLVQKLNARAAEITSWREKGLTPQDIAGRLSVSPQVVREWLRANPTVIAAGKRMQIKQGVAIIACTGSVPKAAEAMGISPASLYGLKKRYPELWQQEVDRLTAADVVFDTNPNQSQRERVKQAVGLLAAGMTLAAASEAMGVKPRALETLRRRNLAVWQEEVDRLAALGHVIPKYRRAAITPRVESGIRKATALLAAGRTVAEVAQELKIHIDALRDWRAEHRELWDRELERAMQAAVVLVRAQAGTEAVLVDPAEYLRRAAAADRWTRQKGQELFAPNGATTLCTFYRDYYKPNRLTGASPSTLESYRNVLRRWAMLTGDPPLAEITTGILAHFRDCLTRLPGRHKHLPLSPNRIRSILRQVQTLLFNAGPSGPHYRDAADILEKVPWVRPPKEELGEPRFVTDAELKAIYTAATAMDMPKIPGFKAPAWWRALIVTTYNCGLRRRTLFELRMEYIDWQKRWLVIPPSRLKNRRILVLPVNDTVLEHLLTIRTERELVFPWPFKGHRFYHYWHKLLDAAGISRAQHFGLHALRKTLASQLWAVAPQAATLALGHAAASTTMRHYVNASASGILADAMAKVPQPWGPIAATA